MPSPGLVFTTWEIIKEDSEGASGLCGKEHHKQLVMSAMAQDGEMVCGVHARHLALLA